jgi:hypothetical protein
MVLGVTCSPQCALLAGVVDHKVVETAVYRINVASIHEASQELEATLEEVGRALAQIRPGLVVLLPPEQGTRFKRTYGQIAPRVALETVVRLAAVRAEIPIEVMPRATVRSRLGIPRSGELASHVPQRLPHPVGPYWAAGRDVAALAALAGESD